MKKLKINTFRTASAAAIICAVMGIMLRMQTHFVQDVLAKFAEEGNLTNASWLVKYAAYFLPIAPVAIVLTVFYTIFKDEHATVQKEKTIATIALIAFTYAFMLPIVLSNKEPIGDDEKTMIDITANWFAFQIVPMLVMLLYHSSMIDEKEENITPATAVEKPEENKAQEEEKKAE